VNESGETKAEASGQTLEAPKDHEPSAAVRFIVDLARFGGRQLIRHRAPQLAAALAYRTIFSLIPILVLSLVVFQAFLGEDEVRSGLKRVLEYTGLSEIRLAEEEAQTETMGPPEAEEPEGGREAQQAPMASDPAEAGPEAGAGEADSAEAGGADAEDQRARSALLAAKIEEFVAGTIERVRSVNFGAVAVVGVLVLIYAALTLIIQVEQAFNLVCRARSGRGMFTRLITYWALLTLGPVFLVGGIVLTGQTTGWLADWPAWLMWANVPLRLIARFGLTWLILVLAYTMLPNSRLGLRSAAVGAVVAAVLWESLKSGLGTFATTLTQSETQFAVYGSIALVPLFLLWIYVTWLIVLFGLELAAALQTVASGRVAALEQLDEGALVDPAVSVVIARAAAEGFSEGEPVTVHELGERSGLAEVTVARVVEDLVDAGILNYVERDGEPQGVTLARPAEKIALSEIIGAVEPSSVRDLPEGTEGRLDDDALLARLRSLRAEALEGMTVRDLLAGEEGGAADASPIGRSPESSGPGAARLEPA